MKNKTYLLIINPVSGLKQGIKKINFIKHLFNTHNIDLDIVFTKYQGHAKQYIFHLDNHKFSNIIIYGGDGTFNEVINGLLSRSDNYFPKLGFLPGGSGNSVMYDLNLLNLEDACHNIIADKEMYIDVMKIKYNNHIEYSINMLGWGMVTDIGILAEKMRWLGPARYNIASLYYILHKKNRLANIVINDINLNDNYLFILLANTKYTGKGMMVAPNAQLDDGFLDLILVKDKINRFQLLKLLPKLFTGDHIKSPYVKYQQIKYLNINPKINELLNIDGEIYGTTPVSIDILNKKLPIFYDCIQ